MKATYLLPMLLLLASCSAGQQDVLEIEDPNHDPEIVKTKAEEELDQVFIARSFAGRWPDSLLLEVRPKEASLKLEPGKSDSSVDLTINYAFQDDASTSFELALKGVECTKDKDVVTFNATGLEGDMSLSLIDGGLTYSDVTVKGQISLNKNKLSSDLLIAGLFRGSDFSIRIDSLSAEKGEPKGRGALVEYVNYSKIVFKNMTSQEICMDLIPDENSGEDKIRKTLSPGEVYSRMFTDVELQVYRTLTITTGGKAVYKATNWTSEDSGLFENKEADLFLIYNENKGRIEPYVYPILTFGIKDSVLE